MSDRIVNAIPPELSRPFHLAEFADSPEHKIQIVTTVAERAALAARYSLLSLDALEAQLTLRSEVSGEIVVNGHLRAELAQQCIVTLEPVIETVSAPFEQRYALQPAALVADLEFGPEDMEPPEPVVGDSIDLGELVAQHLSLSINPYPRAPDAENQTDQYRSNAPDDGPFAALANLREPDRN